MLGRNKRYMSIQHISTRNALKYRKALPMAVLTIQDHEKRHKQQQKISTQAQFFYLNQNQRRNLMNRHSASKITILQTIKSRKSFEPYKKAELHISKNNQNPQISQIYKICRNISKQKQKRKGCSENMIQRMRHKLQKVHIRANISLLLRNRQITHTQRVHAKQDFIMNESMHSSLSCRQVLIQEKKIFSNIKIKNNLKSDLLRAKITNRKEKMLTKSLESEYIGQSFQEKFQGWQMNRRFQQSFDLRDEKSKLFLC